MGPPISQDLAQLMVEKRLFFGMGWTEIARDTHRYAYTVMRVVERFEKRGSFDTWPGKRVSLPANAKLDRHHRDYAATHMGYVFT